MCAPADKAAEGAEAPLSSTVPGRIKERGRRPLIVRSSQKTEASSSKERTEKAEPGGKPSLAFSPMKLGGEGGGRLLREWGSFISSFYFFGWKPNGEKEIRVHGSNL